MVDKRKDVRHVINTLSIVVALRITFLLSQYYKFTLLPFTFRNSAYRALFFSIVRLHAIHVFIAVVLVYYTIISLAFYS
jgi:heme/copper-type cytochrome/quinol oxidase subunit 3